MFDPKLGDVLLRGSDGQYFVLDAVTEKHIAGPVHLSLAIQLARAQGPGTIWQQNTDERGRPVSPPLRIPVAL